jgi:hypothetical protein
MTSSRDWDWGRVTNIQRGAIVVPRASVRTDLTRVVYTCRPRRSSPFLLS